MNHVAVIDIGKTNAKLAVVAADTLAEIGVRTMPNPVLKDGPYPHYDIDGIWDFVIAGLSDFQREIGIDAITVTAHGASIVLLDRSGHLACPVLDYEFAGPDEFATAYDAIRPPFEETGSPRLPMGLNVGAQLHWLLMTRDDLLARIGQLVTYPQYWSGRLTGQFRCEFTSLGCHTDLWLPREARFSTLVGRLGLAALMAPVGKATDCLGPILPQIARRTGLPPETPVWSGIHDSNASLLPHLLTQDQPFSVISTGTWAVSMAIGGGRVDLDAGRDTLINVNALGAPTPSARFMGGREFDLMKSQTAPSTPVDVDSVLDRGLFLLPSVEPRSGPFPGRTGGWVSNTMTPGEKAAALSFYLALMTAECLSLIAAEGPSVVEGPFAQNPDYLDMLEAATGRPVILSGNKTGTSVGAALLALGNATPPHRPQVRPHSPGMAHSGYAQRWLSAVGGA